MTNASKAQAAGDDRLPEIEARVRLNKPRYFATNALTKEDVADFGWLIAALRESRQREARLREALTDCANDLECAINATFPESVRAYPVMQAKYEREMTTVHEARAALKDTQP